MENMKPFRFWSQKVLPLVYDDSLSYYEVLCKAVDYINKLIAQDNEFAGEIGELQTELQGVIDWIDAHSGDEPYTRRYLFIGDSYAAAQYANWPTRLAELLGVEESNYWIVSASGSGFASGTWLSRLMDWTEEHLDIAGTITDIVCAGGINDAATAYFASLTTQLAAFATYAKATFPKAAVRVAYIGACWYDSATYADRPLYNRIGVINAYSQVGKYGMIYMPGCESVMQQTDLFVSDRIHPNTEGGNRIVAALFDAIKNGSAYVTGRGNVTISPIEEEGYPVFTETTCGTQYKEGDTATFQCGIGLDEISGLTLGNTEAVLGNVELPFTTQMSVVKAPALFRVGTTYYEREVTVRVYMGQLRIRLQEQDPQDATAWLEYEPNRIAINFSKTGNVHEF